MAWRIHDCVIRGEIDNRERGVVRGRIWLDGMTDPVVLELKGNACPDLVGCLLTFENLHPTIPMRTDAQFNPLQSGTIGDLTASRKVRVLDLPIEEAYLRKKEGLSVPEHMANCLYLEWFSDANGRVVVESTEYKVTISPPTWRLTLEEEQRRQHDAADGFIGFMQKVSEAVEAAQHHPPEEEKWDEFDYEKFMRASDAGTDKYMELLDKYEDHPDRERLIAKEMGWDWLEEALDEEQRGGGGQSAADSAAGADPAESDKFGANEEEALEIDEINRICAESAENPLQPDPGTQGIDWVRTEDGDIKHPLSLRAFNSSMSLWHKCKDLGLGKTDDDDLGRLITEFQITGAKLAGALNSLAYGRDLTEGAFTVAYLKRALNHVHATQAALERVVPKNLLPADLVASTRNELFGIREEILRLMEEFRGLK